MISSILLPISNVTAQENLIIQGTQVIGFSDDFSRYKEGDSLLPIWDNHGNWIIKDNKLHHFQSPIEERTSNAYWSFDNNTYDSKTGLIEDLTGSNNTAILGDSVNSSKFDPLWISEGKQGGGFYFAGRGEHISVPGYKVSSQNNIYIETWVNANETIGKSQTIILISGVVQLFLRGDGKFVFGIWFTNHGWVTVSSNKLPMQNEWHKVAGSYDGRNLMLYIDDNLEAQTIIEDQFPNADSSLIIGSFIENASPFMGIIDEVRIESTPPSLGYITIPTPVRDYYSIRTSFEISNDTVFLGIMFDSLDLNGAYLIFVNRNNDFKTVTLSRLLPNQTDINQEGSLSTLVSRNISIESFDTMIVDVRQLHINVSLFSSEDKGTVESISFDVNQNLGKGGIGLVAIGEISFQYISVDLLNNIRYNDDNGISKLAISGFVYLSGANTPIGGIQLTLNGTVLATTDEDGFFLATIEDNQPNQKIIYYLALKGVESSTREIVLGPSNELSKRPELIEEFLTLPRLGTGIYGDATLLGLVVIVMTLIITFTYFFRKDIIRNILSPSKISIITILLIFVSGYISIYINLYGIIPFLIISLWFLNRKYKWFSTKPPPEQKDTISLTQSSCGVVLIFVFLLIFGIGIGNFLTGNKELGDQIIAYDFLILIVGIVLNLIWPINHNK